MLQDKVSESVHLFLNCFTLLFIKRIVQKTQIKFDFDLFLDYPIEAFDESHSREAWNLTPHLEYIFIYPVWENNVEPFWCKCLKHQNNTCKWHIRASTPSYMTETWNQDMHSSDTVNTYLHIYSHDLFGSFIECTVSRFLIVLCCWSLTVWGGHLDVFNSHINPRS